MTWALGFIIGALAGCGIGLGAAHLMRARVTSPVLELDGTGRVARANAAAAAVFGAPPEELSGQRVQVGEDIPWSDRLAAIAELTRGIAHELRNPLTALRNAAQLGLMFADPAKKDNLFEEVIVEADRLNEAISNLTTFINTDPGPLAPVRLDQVIAAVLSHIKGILIMRDIKVDCAFSGGLPPVLGHEQQLKQAILNIITSSIQAMPAGGALIIRATYHRDRKQLELIVGDTGAGLAPQTVPRVFRPFAATRHGSSNIGLTIASQIIVELHNGTISCESTIGGGTRIRVELPAFDGHRDSLP